MADSERILRIVPPDADELHASIELPGVCPSCDALRTERDNLHACLDVAEEENARLTRALLRESHHMDRRAGHSDKETRERLTNGQPAGRK